jgi:hypothetical protein
MLNLIKRSGARNLQATFRLAPKCNHTLVLRIIHDVAIEIKPQAEARSVRAACKAKRVGAIAA